MPNQDDPTTRRLLLVLIVIVSVLVFFALIAFGFVLLVTVGTAYLFGG